MIQGISAASDNIEHLGDTHMASRINVVKCECTDVTLDKICHAAALIIDSQVHVAIQQFCMPISYAFVRILVVGKW